MLAWTLKYRLKLEGTRHFQCLHSLFHHKFTSIVDLFIWIYSFQLIYSLSKKFTCRLNSWRDGIAPSTKWKQNYVVIESFPVCHVCSLNDIVSYYLAFTFLADRNYYKGCSDRSFSKLRFHFCEHGKHCSFANHV